MAVEPQTQSQPDGAPEPSGPLEMVCGRVIVGGTASFYHPTEFNGRLIYFCTEFCCEAFLADPERFYAAHSKNKKG